MILRAAVSPRSARIFALLTALSVLLPNFASVAAAPAVRSALPGLANYHYRVDDLRYRGGPVISASTSYVIFWRPPGKRYEPLGNDDRYMRLMLAYLRDVGSTPFFNILTQYSYGPSGSPTIAPGALGHRRYDRVVAGGPIQNRSRVGGQVLDTSPYPHAGTKRDPLRYLDFAKEVRRVMHRQNWKPGLTHVFYLFTAGNPRMCFVGPKECLPSAGCSTHVSYGTMPNPLIVDVLADVNAYPNCRSPEATGKYAHRSVNGDTLADFEITILSHEQFETITDPLDGNGVTPTTTNAWYDENPSNGEIGDKCESILDAVISANLDNVRLGGHRYHVQEEWSNVNHNCVTMYPRRRSTKS